MSFWPHPTTATNPTTFTAFSDAAVSSRTLASFDGVAGTNFAGTPWMKAIRISQTTNPMAIYFEIPPGIFGANGVNVHPDEPLSLRFGLRAITTNERQSNEELVVQISDPNVSYQDTYRGLLMDVNTVATQWRRGVVGGCTEWSSGGQDYITNSMSVDISVSDDAGFQIILGPHAGYHSCYGGTQNSSQDFNTRVIFITRLFES